MKHFLIQKSNSQVLVESIINECTGEPVVLESDLYYNVTANRLTSALAAINLHCRKVKMEARYVCGNGTLNKEVYRDPFERWEAKGFPALPYKDKDIYIKEVPA